MRLSRAFKGILLLMVFTVQEVRRKVLLSYSTLLLAIIEHYRFYQLTWETNSSQLEKQNKKELNHFFTLILTSHTS